MSYCLIDKSVHVDMVCAGLAVNHIDEQQDILLQSKQNISILELNSG